MFRLIEYQVVRQSKLRHALPIVLVIIAALFSPLTVNAAPGGLMVQTKITSLLAPNPKMSQLPAGITWNLSVQTSLINTPVVASIHQGSCTGNKILALPSQNTNGSGYVDWGAHWFHNEVNGNPAPTAIPTDGSWFLNLQDTISGNNPSIACLPIQTQTPDYWEVVNYSTNIRAHAMVQTKITTSLTPNPQTSQSPAGITWDLGVQTSLINVPVVAYIHQGSCTGNKILALPSQNTNGSGYVDWGPHWFQNDVNSNPIPTAIPTDGSWFLDLQDTASGDNPSIACLPIQTQTPGYWAVGNYGTNTNTHAMVQTQITTSLAPNPQTSQSPAGITWDLSVQTSLINAPVIAHVHQGSCTGNKILALPSQNTDGSGYVDWGPHWFQNDVNGNPIPTAIPTDGSWFLDLQDTASGDNPSIACLPIQTQTPGYWRVVDYGTNTSTNVMVQATIKSSLAPNPQTSQSPAGITWNLRVQTSLIKAPVVASIHQGNCWGNKILALPPQNTDGSGYVDWGSHWFQNDVNGNPVPTAIPTDGSWFLRLQDTALLIYSPIACIPIQTQTPGHWAVGNYGMSNYV